MSGSSLHLEIISRGWVSLLAMMNTMEEELKVTLFLGRLGRLCDITIGRTGCSMRVRGRSLMLCCRVARREHSICNMHLRNWPIRKRNVSYTHTYTYIYRHTHTHTYIYGCGVKTFANMIKRWKWDKTTECHILLLALSTHTCFTS